MRDVVIQYSIVLAFTSVVLSLAGIPPELGGVLTRKGGRESTFDGEPINSGTRNHFIQRIEEDSKRLVIMILKGSQRLLNAQSAYAASTPESTVFQNQPNFQVGTNPDLVQ
jgi:hypothetical protein